MKIYKDARRQKQANTIKGVGNPNWKGGRIQKNCIRCVTPFFVYPSTSTRTHCSLICANRDTSDTQRGLINPKKIHYGKDNGCWRGGDIQRQCKECGREFTTSRRSLGRYCSQDCKNKNNGKGKGDYLLERDWRETVLKRDNYTCQQCGSKNKIETHHKKTVSLHPELKYDVFNGISLCSHCHKRIEYQK